MYTNVLQTYVGVIDDSFQAVQNQLFLLFLIFCKNNYLYKYFSLFG